LKTYGAFHYPPIVREMK